MKKRQKLDNLICICGHLGSDHELPRAKISKPILGKWWSGCWAKKDPFPNDLKGLRTFADDCNSFQVDNLKYIEKAYEKIQKE